MKYNNLPLLLTFANSLGYLGGKGFVQDIIIFAIFDGNFAHLLLVLGLWIYILKE